MNVKTKPYKLLLPFVVLLILISFFVQNNSMDIHLHDTYLIVSLAHIVWAIAVVLLFIWLLYKLTSKFLFSNWLSWVHVIATILSVFFLVALLFSNGNFLKPIPRLYVDIGNVSVRAGLKNYGFLSKMMVISVLGQAAFLVNLFLGIYKFQIKPLLSLPNK